MKQAIGVDLGGSHVTAGVIEESGKILAQHEQDIIDRSFDRVVEAVTNVIIAALTDAGKTAKNGSEPIPIGIGAAGNIDLPTGTVVYSPNLGWSNAPLGARLREEFKQPLFIGNDARCATLGEYTFGIGKGTKNFLLITVGTGLGGGIIGEGHLLLGNRFGAGEVGHQQIRPNGGFVCTCGKIGCFEVQASGTGLIRHAFAVATSFPRSALLDVSREKLSSKKIRKAAQAGDLHALAAWRNYTEDLALGLANLVSILNPETIAIGGGVSTAADFMLDAIRPRIDELTTMVPKGTTSIDIAKLGNDAGQVGAALMALKGGLQNC